jgi:3-deoxy-manno-octulosonate cytidylyltransferase (CMP-KDO synthetase)
MKIIAVIPARYASTRLPGKPLLAETGKPLIQHVVQSVRAASEISDVVVATDDQRIADAVERFGGTAVMTRVDHTCGTDRLAEAADILGLADEDVVVNIQGDEPDIPANCINALVELIRQTDSPMATLAAALPAEQAEDPNRVKVVLAGDGSCLYFSRAKIPHDRDASGLAAYLLHLGAYAYRAGFLRTFVTLEQTPAELSEKLEQLRVLEHGYRIVARKVDYHGKGIDTPADYRQFVASQKPA